jgi:hypothetical protein
MSGQPRGSSVSADEEPVDDLQDEEAPALEVTPAQYEVYIYLFEEERRRAGAIDQKAKTYLTIMTILFGALALAPDRIFVAGTVFAPSGLIVTVIVAAGCTLFVAFFLTSLALSVFSYEAICDPEEALTSAADEGDSDNVFLANRAVDLAVATNRNFAVNNKRVVYLQIASFGILVSILFVFVFVILYLNAVA